MKCPLLCLGKLAVGEITQDTLSDCLEKECAWYDSIIQTCILYSLHADLAYLGARLKELVDKMPHEEQFRK